MKKAIRKSEWLFWRSGWDSNPRGIAPKLISSQPRYDHFDTAAYDLRERTLPPPAAGAREAADIKNTRQWAENQGLSARFPHFLFSGPDSKGM